MSISSVETSGGTARLHLCGPTRGPVLALGHGAGGGVDSDDLQIVTACAVDAGWRVVLVEQPWRVAGRKLAAPPKHLDACWLEALASLGTPVEVVGGRSAGARVACRTAAQVQARGVLLLAFPLHPPGRPEKSRADEIAEVKVPVLAVQGERDSFGTASELRTACPVVHVVEVEAADHSLRVPARSGSSGISGALPQVMAFLDGYGGHR